MAVVKVTPYPSGHGYKLEIDGVEIPDLCDFSLAFPVDGMAQCNLTVLVSAPVEFTVDPATVHMHLHLPDGHALVDVTTQDDPLNSRKLMVTKITDQPADLRHNVGAP